MSCEINSIILRLSQTQIRRSANAHTNTTHMQTRYANAIQTQYMCKCKQEGQQSSAQTVQCKHNCKFNRNTHTYNYVRKNQTRNPIHAIHTKMQYASKCKRKYSYTCKYKHERNYKCIHLRIHNQNITKTQTQHSYKHN